VLRLVGMSLKQNIKGQDITARYGGEEFAVVLPNTVLRSALTVADHIRRAVMAKELMKRSTGEISAASPSRSASPCCARATIRIR
jgi:diguanylate cyclase